MRTRRVLAVAVALLAIVLLAFLFIGPKDRTDGEAPAPTASLGATAIQRGRALVTLADCRTCHTARGGQDFAGGHAIPTPFGVFYSPNITPDAQTGIGAWTNDDFWHALHNGYSRDGRPLYPTFPYTNYTKISRRDAQDMYEYLRTIEPVRKASRQHELKFPYDRRVLLLLWRRLFFRPGVYEADRSRSGEWNRGAYLVEGLAHCSACHEARNSLGAIQSKRNPAGGLVLNWYAPSLARAREAGLQNWPEQQIVRFLASGHTAGATAMGPMAEVIYASLQHVSPDALDAMAVYLKSIPDTDGPPQAPSNVRQADNAAILESGGKNYAKHCAECHGDNGEGKPPAAGALARNRAVTISNVTNPVRIVLYGGYPPGTAGNPRPFGMPPFADRLSNVEIAEVLTYVRSAWGNQASAVTATDVVRNRTGPQW
jgi:mono/diheme cytochrome c family protein